MSTAAVADTRPRFSGMVRAELLKVGRARSTWVLAMIPFAGIGLLGLLALGASGLPSLLHEHPLGALRSLVDVARVVCSGTSGIFLLVLSARAVALDADHGTIRVLLARGTGKARLLAAKIAALGLIGTGLVVGGVVLGTAWCCTLILVAGHSLGPLLSLSAALPGELGLAAAALSASMACCIALGCAMGVVGHRLALALPLALGWFVADNAALVVLDVVAYQTGHAGWRAATGYLLGPNLNALVQALDPARAPAVRLPSPVDPVDGPHALAVIALYCLGFMALAFGLTVARRDVLD